LKIDAVRSPNQIVGASPGVGAATYAGGDYLLTSYAISLSDELTKGLAVTDSFLKTKASGPRSSGFESGNPPRTLRVGR
jgi:hypothetical protein